MARDFNLYCSVPPDELRALERVVDSARACARAQADGEARDGHAAELVDALNRLDAIGRRREGGDTGGTGTLVPWLHRHLRRSSGGGTAWRPDLLEGRRAAARREGAKSAS